MEKQKCPEIRFKYFRECWVKNELNQFGKIFTGGGTPSTSDESYWNGDLPWFQSSDLSDENVIQINTRKLITQVGLKNSAAKKIEKNSIAIVTRVGVGKVVLIPFEYATSQDFLSISSLEVDSLYAVYLISQLMKNESKNTQGTSIKGITNDVLLKKEVYISLNEHEQKQLGNFFQNLDQSITLQEKKLIQTKNIKKAMLEKMFPKAGSKQPEIRLKGFSGEWEEFQLKDLGDFKNGMNMDKDSMGFGNPFVNIQHIFESSEVTKHNLELVNATNKQIKDYNLLKGDVLFVRSSVKLEGVGDTAVLVDDIEEATYSGFLIRFRSNINLSLDYKKVMFSIPLVRKQILANATTSANTNINQESLKKVLILLPKYEEQTQIGLFFRHLDETLVLQQQQLQTLKNLKQAFLEKMFV